VGLKGLMSGLSMNPFGVISLVLFLSSFLAVLVWTCTRTRQEIEEQSRLWEDDEDHG
jgi:hypothetical protein